MVCSILREALILSRKRCYREALAKVGEARAILSNYFEIYRISAFIRASNDDLLGAENDYKTALGLNGEDSRLLYFYAGFLVLQMKDPSGALPYAQKAYALRPNSLETATLYARCIGYAGDYPKAIELLLHLLDSESNATAKNKKIITTLTMDFYRRYAEDERTIKKEYANAIVTAQKALNVFGSAVSGAFVDDRILQELAQIFQEYRNSVQEVPDDSERQIYYNAVREHSEYLARVGRGYLVDEARSPMAKHGQEEGEITDVRVGTVVERDPQRQYAFIECQHGERFFFHRSYLVSVRRTHLGTVDVQRYCALL